MILLLVIGFILAIWGITYPFAGIYNANNNYLMLAARNFLRFGFLHLRFFPSYFAGQNLPIHIPFYLHHPILVFSLSAVPFIMFGFHNWVVHVTNGLFLIGDILLIYKIGETVWNKKVGLWAAGIAMIFPMTTFFWKYIFFEQGSLFFNLCIVYVTLTYLKTPRNFLLALLFLFSILSGLTDWGVLYLFIPFMVFGKKIMRPMGAYLAGAIISIGFFIVSVYFLRGGFNELIGAIAVHGYTDLLFNMPLWPLRLLIITITRCIVYFSPLTLIWVVYGIKKLNKVLLFFFIFGCMNLLVLPTVTWENSYFLFYFIPFMSYAGALWFTSVRRPKFIVWSAILILITGSITVNYFKIIQVQKQLWKFDAARKINSILTPYEPVGVVNFPGDIFENYYYHPTCPMKLEQIPGWLIGNVCPNVHRIIFSCDDGCNVVQIVSKTGTTITITGSPQSGENSILLKYYRMIRLSLGIAQL